MTANQGNQGNQAEQQAERLEQSQRLYMAGQLAFERGNYRSAIAAFEEAIQLASGTKILSGSIQIWLMNAYAAANRQQDAIAVGEKLAKHPDRDIRKQSQRVLEILQAPQLKRRADWITPIPDLSNLDAERGYTLNRGTYVDAKPLAKPSPRQEPEQADWSQINTRDNGFLWLALSAIVLTFAGLWLL